MLCAAWCCVRKVKTWWNTLAVALIAFGSIAGMGILAEGINQAFSGIATTVVDKV